MLHSKSPIIRKKAKNESTVLTNSVNGPKGFEIVLNFGK